MQPNDMVGQFQIRELLGAGGIGQVHAAVDTVLGREVAIKSLRPELLSDTSFLERFRTEAVNLAQLNHPNVATLYSLLPEGKNLFMVMELVRGKSLEEILQARGSRFGVQESLAIIAQAADGLAYAHEMGIIHRDIKPANLMITETGRLKVMDFGIARARGSQRMTRDGSIVGTLAYISPEQLKGGEGDERSDLYSLAIVLYELLSGAPPFSATTDYDLIQAHVNAAPPRLVPQVAGVSREIEDALLKALAKKPADRFASLYEFSEALGAARLRANATSIIRSPAALLSGADTNATASTSVQTTRAAAATTSGKSGFWALPVEARGLIIGGTAAVLAGAVIVLPSMLRSPAKAPEPVGATSRPAAPPQVALPAPVPSAAAPANPNFIALAPSVPSVPAAPPPAPASAPMPAAAPTPAPLPPVIAAAPAPLPPSPVVPAPSPVTETQPRTAPETPAIAASTATPPPALPLIVPPAPVAPPPPPPLRVSDLQAALVRQDFGQAFDMASRLANDGDVEAQFLLANMYRSGRGARQSHIEAALWYGRAADKGHQRATYNLALLHHLDLLSGDKRKNQREALELFQKAAETGYSDAQWMLGSYHEEGLAGLRKDRKAAVEHYQKAASGGHEEARKRLETLGVKLQ
ncbi:MAG: serine/threonine-protein kinase [Bosea sp. (in: a-proteobacteria)]